MTMRIKALAAVAAGALLAASAFAQSASQVGGSGMSVPSKNEPVPKLIVDRPLPGPLARGSVLIPYRLENLRNPPARGADAVTVSRRVGHLQVTVDDQPWPWGGFSDDNTLVVVGLPPGQHKVLIELANPEQHIVTEQTVTFTVPDASK
jgi:hypothetical protein